MIEFIPPIILNSPQNLTSGTASKRVYGVRAFIGASFLIALLFSACKRDMAQSSGNAQHDLTNAVVESDSMFSQLYTVQQSFQSLKASMAAAPDAVRQTPEFQALQARLEGAIVKSGIFYDEIDAAKTAAANKIKGLQANGAENAAAIDSELTVVRQLVEHNKDTYEAMGKAASMFKAEFEKIQSAHK